MQGATKKKYPITKYMTMMVLKLALTDKSSVETEGFAEIDSKELAKLEKSKTRKKSK